MLTGTCLCGDIAFAIDGAVDGMAHCHCSMCRKFHGAAYATFAAVRPEQFRWLRGEDDVRHYQSSAKGWRHFCPRCGGPAPAYPPGGPFALVPMGNVAEDPGTRPTMHIFAASMAPWHHIADDLPRHDEYPPEFGPDAHAVPRQARTARKPGAIGGSCLCGAAVFEYDGAPTHMLNCHCSRCRRAMGAAHATMIFVRHAAFRWLAGEQDVTVYKMPESKVKGTAFCRHCGSQVARWRDANFVQIPAGCLDDDPPARPTANIFTASKAAWSALDERLPGFVAAPN